MLDSCIIAIYVGIVIFFMFYGSMSPAILIISSKCFEKQYYDNIWKKPIVPATSQFLNGYLIDNLLNNDWLSLIKHPTNILGVFTIESIFF